MRLWSLGGHLPLEVSRRVREFPGGFILPLWLPTFGHFTMAMDFAARLCHPNLVRVLALPSERVNYDLGLCYENIDLQVLTMPSGLAPTERDERAVQRMAGFFSRSDQLLLRREHFLGFLSAARKQLEFGVEEHGEEMQPYPDVTGYIQLLKLGIGRRPRLPDEHQEAAWERLGEAAGCRQERRRRGFVTLHLREKGSTFSDASRSAGPHENYLGAVREICRRGYIVVGAGGTRHSLFADIPGYIPETAIRLRSSIRNIFLLTEARLYVGQQSGPLILTNSAGVPTVLCDAAPHRVGTFRSDDLVLFKHIVIGRDRRTLGFEELFRDHLDLVQGTGFSRKQASYLPNTPGEILAAIMEALDRLEGVAEPTEHRDLVDRFVSLVPENILLKYQGNRPPIAQLKQDYANGGRLD